MATKGASFRYGNTNGSNHKGKETDDIKYAWAKGFNKGGLNEHFKDHGKEFGANNKNEYAAKAVHFANEIDKKNYKSVVDYKNTTYKYNPKSGALVIVTNDGYVVSFHHFKKFFTYHPEKGVTEKIWISK